MGDIQPGTTILGGIQKTVDSSAVVKYNADGKFEGGAKADACVVVIGEQPYAEGKGDDIGSTLSGTDLDVLKAMRPQCAKMVVVMLSGRPLIVTDQLPQMDAFVAAWLPGTEGEGVSDVLFGDKPFTGKLPYTWPRSYKQLPFDFANLATSGENAPLFPFGFGLSN
jgi:beta-glucosidase